MAIMKVRLTEQFKQDLNVLTGKTPAKAKKNFLNHRLAEVAEKRREILDDKIGQGIFSTRLVLPEQEDYSGWRPMGDLYFTISLSRKYEDIYYLYMMHTFDSRAYSIAIKEAEHELYYCKPKYHAAINFFETDTYNYCKHIDLTPEKKKENEAYEAWVETVEERAKEIARAGVEITPCFFLNDFSAGIEVFAVVDVKEFTADGIIEAINKFLDHCCPAKE